MEKLNSKDLINLIRSVFPRFPEDRALGILTDIPKLSEKDNQDWAERRNMAQEWYNLLQKKKAGLELENIKLIAYPDVESNNADLPEFAFEISGPLPASAAYLDSAGNKISFENIFTSTQLFLAPTELSTTAPLKVASKKFGFRAATMPGFSAKMIPALKIDYTEVNRRVMLVKDRLDPAIGAEMIFATDTGEKHQMYFDLRFRKAHASSGRFPDKGTAGNVPSGEAYIVPYEGELEESSLTQGVLPVQIEHEIVLFAVEENRATKVISKGEHSQTENTHLQREPAYGNMGELGFGVLADFGLEPINQILLDEKLGFHIAFGRSEHFGGAVGPNDFSSPQEVIHLDRIYIPATQPRITVQSIILQFQNNRKEKILEKGKYLIF